jgi:hypothetical protein
MDLGEPVREYEIPEPAHVPDYVPEEETAPEPAPAEAEPVPA